MVKDLSAGTRWILTQKWIYTGVFSQLSLAVYYGKVGKGVLLSREALKQQTLVPN